MISGEVGTRKPGPEIFGHFLERFGLTPETTVFIDDWDLNVARARELGMVAVQFVSAAQLRQDLRELGVPVAAA